MKNSVIRQTSSRISRPILFVLLVSLLALQAFQSQANEEQTCARLFKGVDLSKLDDGNAATSIVSAKFIRGKILNKKESHLAHEYSRILGAPTKYGLKKLPDHCLVEGYVTPTIRFQIRLPAQQDWNGRYLLNACQGFCGEVNPGPPMAGVARRYATMSHDGGHTAFGFDGAWGRNNLPGRIDFGHRANHVVAIAAKAIINYYYGKSPKYSIIAGCSKGGQAGVMAAQRYPNDFDGVIARGPTINYTKVNLVSCMDHARAVLDDNDKPLMDATYADFIYKAVVKHCDAIDGVKDGLISDPRKCDFDPQTLACDDNPDAKKCLNPAQVTAVKRLYSPIKDDQGKTIYGPMTYGSEPEWKDWLMPSIPGVMPWHYYAATEFLKYLAYPTAPTIDYNWRDFNYSAEKSRLAEMGTVYNADNPDLREFRDAGGKMMIIHGYADAAISPYPTIDWYEDVVKFMGGYEKTADFNRLFLLPGLHHCGSNGPGPSSYDALEALEQWMEHGKAPDMLLTRKEEKGKVLYDRPVYPYPIEVKYRGQGDTRKAKNFKPYDPRVKG